MTSQVASQRRSTRTHTGITFHHPAAFWVGTASVVAGVLLHLPDFFGTADMQYQLAGMAMSRWMLLGMFMIVGGLALAGWGLLPRKEQLRHTSSGHGYALHAMDGAELTPAHWGLLFVLGVALIVDVMKPATLGFVVPGMAKEYGISTARAALLPLCALTGTTLGSLFWGMLSDRVGRRAAILLASLIFIGTSICGFMPSFGWNLAMCFIMGLSAGGMLPIVYALMSESVPSKRRGWLVVLHGGMGTVGGYLAASGLAALLVPHFGWRILWFLGLPTGGLMLILNRWIPESPRFLLERGRIDEARNVMARYGVVVEETTVADDTEAPASSGSHFAGLGKLFRRPFAGQTGIVLMYGLSWGFVNWVFLTFLPSQLEGAGFSAGSASRLLFVSALLAVPGTVVVAYLYGLWSSRWSMGVYAGVTACCLLAFAFIGSDAATVNRLLLIGLVGLLLVASGGVISMLSPYTAEVFPTNLRGTGSGLAAASSKFGGIIGASAVTTGLLTVSTGLTIPAIAVAIPVAISAVIVTIRGVETRGRALEEITSLTPALEEPYPQEVGA